LGNAENSFLASESLSVTKRLQYFIVEKEKTARAFLKQIGHPKPQNELIFFELNKHQVDDNAYKEFFDIHISSGIGLISEAGMPCLADPGNIVVAYAHQKHFEVYPLVGASAILLALVSSGFNGQSFAFAGYLPIEKQKRKKYIKEMERRVVEKNETQIFMETPYRNQTLFHELIKVLHPQTWLHISCDFHLASQENLTLQISDWQHKDIDLHKRQVVFCLGSSRI